MAHQSLGNQTAVKTQNPRYPTHDISSIYKNIDYSANKLQLKLIDTNVDS